MTAVPAIPRGPADRFGRDADAVPADAVPGDAVPGDAVPGDVVPRDAAVPGAPAHAEPGEGLGTDPPVTSIGAFARARTRRAARAQRRASTGRPPAGVRSGAPGEVPVIKLGGPPDICEAVPFLVGFEPEDSVVVIALTRPRKRVGLTMRVDLVEARHAEDLGEMLATHAVGAGARSSVVVVYADTGHPSADTVAHGVIDALARAGAPVEEALRVTDGRWTSYTCHEPCCPPTGTPVRDRMREPGEFAATMVARGRQVLPSRSLLVEMLAPMAGPSATEMTAALRAAADEWNTVVHGDEAAHIAYIAATVALTRTWLDRLVTPDASGREPGEWLTDLSLRTELPPDTAARLLVGLAEKPVRDEFLPWSWPVLAPPEGVERLSPPGPEAAVLWAELTRRAVLPGYAAAPATLFGWCAYLYDGSGALANVAIQRAYDDVPHYLMARYLDVAIQNAIHPDTMIEILTGSDAEFPAAFAGEMP